MNTGLIETDTEGKLHILLPRVLMPCDVKSGLQPYQMPAK